MTHSSAIITGGPSPHIEWNGIADMGMILAIDALRDQVLSAINTSLADQPQEPHNPDLDYGTRA